jgi:hypothetical protein
VEFSGFLNLQPLDYKKAQILFAMYCIVAPIAGFIMRRQRTLQRVTFLAMCFMITSGIWHAQEWGLTIHPILYRGHSRGFHFYWAEVAAVALIFAHMFGNWKRFRFFPPGFWLYILYCSACLLSIVNAPIPLFALFAAWKAFKVVLIFVAAYNFIRTEEDLRFALISLALVMLWQLVAVLNQKYVLGIYQVWGTFEHQNSLSMFTILIGMVFLSVAMGPKRPSSLFFCVAFIACAAIVQSTLSRAGLFIFAFGTVCVVLASLMDKATRRRLAVLAGIGAVGFLGLCMTLDTIVKRFTDYGNDESKRTREHLNIAAHKMLLEYPLGIGWNNFAQVINPPFPYGDHIDEYYRQTGNTVDRKYKKGVVESLWWLHLAETGYQGLITYLVIIFLFLFWNVQNIIYYRRRYLGAVSIGLLVGSLMNYGQSFLERVLTQPRNVMLWLIMLAITARITMWRKSERRRRNREWRERIERIPVQRQLAYQNDPEEPVAV